MKRISTLFKIVLIVFWLFANIQNLYADGGNKRIAVLPFENLMKDANINGLSAGISVEIITKLGKVFEKVPGFTLIERNQSEKVLKEQAFQLGGYVDPETITQVGKQAGANVVVVGEYQKVGDKLKITGRFVEVETGKATGTAEVTGNYADVFELESNIAFELIKALNIANNVAQETEIKKQIEEVAPQTSNVSAYELVNKGYELYYSGHGNEAIELYDKAIEIDGNYACAYYVRGLVYSGKKFDDEAKKDYYLDKAIKDYTKAIELDPTGDPCKFTIGAAYGLRAWDYEDKGLYDEAIKDHTKEMELDPKNDYYYFQRGDDYSKKGLYDEAIKDYTQEIELATEDKALGYYNRCNAYYNKELYDEAIEDCTKAIKLDEKFVDIYYVRGLSYSGKGLDDKAVKDFKKVVDLGGLYADLAKQALKDLYNIKY